MWSLSLSHQPSRQQCTCMTPVVPVLPVLPLQRCPVWGRACRYRPGDDLSTPLLFSEGAESLKSLYFCTDVVFSTPMPHHPGQAAAAQQGNLCQLEPGDEGDPGGGHSWSIPLTPGVLCLFGVLGHRLHHSHSFLAVCRCGGKVWPQSHSIPGPPAQGETGDRAPGAKRKSCRSEILPGKTTMGRVVCRADSLTDCGCSFCLGRAWSAMENAQRLKNGEFPRPHPGVLKEMK